jgi:predicted PurR-regulated permease PerM
MKTYPTPWQLKVLWSTATALSIVAVGGVAVLLVVVVSRALNFLQPILIPFAVAGVLAYLLDPLVSWLVRLGTSRRNAVVFVFAIFTIALAGLLVWIVPAITQQSISFARRVPGYTERTKNLVLTFAADLDEKYGVRLLPEKAPTPDPNASPAPVPGPGATPAPAVAPPDPAADVDAAVAETFDLQRIMSGDWVRTSLPGFLRSAWDFIKRSVGGFLGIFGFALSLIIVPLYLFYFLIESRRISQSWSDYLPLRASAFKDEVVSVLKEINGYLIAFFRGQLFVSLINGTATGLGLIIVGLDFGLLVGLLLCVLGIIPYLGIIISWIPAVIIAAVQGGSWMIPAQPWWVFPLVVTGIFTIVQQIDGFFITPKVVGDSVGLHPVTVIMSVFLWSLVMGGLLGAIVAVPMTATLKVLLRRYVWERQFRREAILTPGGDEAVLIHPQP